MAKVIIICLFLTLSTAQALEHLRTFLEVGVGNREVSQGSRQDSVELLTWDRELELVVLTRRPAALDGRILPAIPCKGHQNSYQRLFKSVRSRQSLWIGTVKLRLLSTPELFACISETTERARQVFNCVSFLNDGIASPNPIRRQTQTFSSSYVISCPLKFTYVADIDFYTPKHTHMYLSY